MDFWQTVTDLGKFGIVSWAVTYLLKKAVEQMFSRDIEKFKKDLENKAFEHQIKQQTLHEKRAHVIAELYSRFISSFRAFHTFFSPWDVGNIPKEEMGKIAAKNFKEFKDYFFVHEIYFSQEVCDLLCQYIEKCIELKRKFQRNEEDVDKLTEVWEKFKEDIVIKIKKHLEEEFRRYLGVS